MADDIIKRNDFRIFPPKGIQDDNAHVDLTSVLLTGRISRSGLRVLIFPPPYHLEVTQGERVSPAKWARLVAAVADLTKGGAA